MTIASEITRIKTNIENAYAKAEEKGATMPELLNSENLAGCIESVPKGSGGGESNDYDAPEGYYYVTYYDIDGTILYRDTVQAETNYTIPAEYVGKYDPENLTFKKWNLDNSNDSKYFTPVLQNMHMCALYENKEDKEYSKVFIHTNEEYGKEVNLGIWATKGDINSTYAPKIIEIWWGDGTTNVYLVETELENIDDYYYYLVSNHVYSDYGDYVIKILYKNKNSQVQSSYTTDVNVSFFIDENTSKMIYKMYDGTSCQVSNGILDMYGYTCFEKTNHYNTVYNLINLEVMNIISTSTIGTIKTLGNSKLKVLCMPNCDYNMSIDNCDIEYIFNSSGLNAIRAYSNQTYKFKNFSYLRSYIYDLYKNNWQSTGGYNTYTRMSVFEPYLGEDDVFFPFLEHIDRNYIYTYKNCSTVYYIYTKDDDKHYLLSADEIAMLDDVLVKGKFLDSHILPATPSLKFKNDMAGASVSVNNATPNNEDIYYIAVSGVNRYLYKNTAFNNVNEKYFGNVTIVPTSVPSDSSSAMNLPAYNYFSNAKSLSFHNIFKKYNFYSTSSLSFTYLNPNIKELDLSAINNYGQSYFAFSSSWLKGSGIQKIIFHENVTDIGYSDTSALFQDSASTYVDLSSLNNKSFYIAKMFYNCKNLKKVKFPENFTLLGNGGNNTNASLQTFYGCSELAEAEIPPQIKVISGTMFYSCSKLKKVWMPSSVQTINTSSYSNSPFSSANQNVIIYTDATSKPSGWGTYWNYTASNKQAKVYWGATKENYENGDLPPES